MLIHINLHPEGGRRRRRGLPKASPAIGRALAPLRDKYLIGAVVAVVASCGAVAALHLTQTAEAAELTQQEEAAQRDSARFAGVIAARAKVLARRDSLGRELRIITAIDSTRYTWAHLLDEVSATLPPYTWLSSVTQTSAPPAPPTTVVGKAGAKPVADTKAAAPNGAKATTDSVPTLRFRVVGQTVDLQALTLFMRDLEASPFVRNVQLVNSAPAAQQVQGSSRELTEFTLDAEYERPTRDVLRTVTISVPVR
ncbi:Fimbrial assembly family protein [Gemmatirosa kalamazoonensis]|uniref:Fimbrial assembly family protein n=1 Tax=Gemmatirosa kalamazoonensis TaxID=861299 RepID=W0RM30_9BACT|nr:PilN domain-containing protein [Gemmatirosa kalamazoonensis]AHG91517.1 Fimbrial assembly family protein [Gemmatirosa kalamazoonensis]